MYPTAPEKTDLIEAYYDRMNLMYATYGSNNWSNPSQFSSNMVKYLVKRGYSKTFSGIVTSLYVVKFGLSNMARHTTTSNRANQLGVICKKEGLNLISYKTEFSTKKSVIITPKNG